MKCGALIRITGVAIGVLLAMCPSCLYAIEPPELEPRPYAFLQAEKIADLPEGALGKTLRVSPDGKRLAFFVQRDDDWFAVSDGVETPAYQAVVEDSIHFSPDSRRLAYAAKRDGKGIVVVDGKEFPSDASCVKGYPIFTVNSDHFLNVVAHYGGRMSVGFDGVLGEVWDALAAPGPILSPNGQRHVYVGLSGEKARLVADGHAGGIYRGVIAPTFSPDSRHVAYIGFTSTSSLLVVDEHEILRSEYFVLNSLAFDSPDRLHVLSMTERGEIHRHRVDLTFNQ